MSDYRRRTYCCVFGCLNNSSTPELSLFRLPIEQERRIQWLRLIDREDLINKSQPKHVVCEAHFHPEDITKNSVRRLLKKNCLPSLNLPNLKKVDKSTQVEITPLCNNSCQTETTSAPSSNDNDLTIATSSCQTEYSRDQMLLMIPPEDVVENIKRMEQQSESGGSHAAIEVYPDVKTEYFEIDEADEWSQQHQSVPGASYQSEGHSENEDQSNDSQFQRAKRRRASSNAPSDNMSQHPVFLQSEVSGVAARPEDTFDNFGKYVASLLRGLPPQDALRVQPRIIDMIVNLGVKQETNQITVHIDRLTPNGDTD